MGSFWLEFQKVVLFFVLSGLLGCSRNGSRSAEPPASPPPLPRAIEALDYVEVFTGGGDGTATLPLIVAVHGLGDRPESFAGLFADFPQEARVILPRGPTPWHGGYSWFDISLPFSAAQASLAEGIGRAAAQVARLIAAVERSSPTRGRPIVTGFSQGGMIAFAVAARHPRTVKLAIPLSGALPASLISSDEALPPIRALHGSDDRTVPTAAAEASTALLIKKGADVSLTTYPGVAHSISRLMRDELFRLLNVAISDTKEDL